MQELELDKNDYFKRHIVTAGELERINEMYKVNGQIDVFSCKIEYEIATKDASLNDENCPYWGPWRSIGQFGGPNNECSKKCGFGTRQKIRDCYIKGIKQNKPDKCISEIIR